MKTALWMTAANCTENRLSSWNTGLNFLTAGTQYTDEEGTETDFLNKPELNVGIMFSFLLGILKKTSTN